ncbi:hypothetical protein ACFFX1_21920 [Dactylosporangium sucinum]|uniref:Uncharacterized protein n=1 Tax=Dactylosporangium sucinum TaxID=1424081 RepID=A0A917U1M2_9ACTN|nr:hypothetical protein [Dactylosporangium sucinum]GGM46188.1 hypothetical protein GCM10007977_054930 [Dactylosporangium sucinum]
MLDTATSTTTTPRRATALAAALFTAPWGFVVANAAYAWSTRDGGSDGDGAGALALAAAHPGPTRLSALAAMVGSLLIVPAVLGVKRLIGDRGGRLAGIAAALTAGGYICYFGIAMSTFVTLAMARQGGSTAGFAAVLDEAQSDPSALWVFLLFVLGNLVGTVLLAVALFRSRTVAAWVAVALGAWAPLHITGLVAGTEWFEVAGAVSQAVALAAVGRALLKAPGPH